MNEATLYTGVNGDSRRDIKQIMEKFANKIQWRNDGNDSLIDIGTGPGDSLMDFVYPLMPSKFEKVVCTDISEKMMNFARKKYAELQRTHFRVLDIAGEELPKQLHGSFDHVVSFNCLHWVQNQRKALANINQLIRDEGGDCLLVFFVQNFFFDVYKLLAKHPKWGHYMQDYQQFISPFEQSTDPAAEYAQLLQQAGFVEYQIELQHKEYVHEGIHKICGLIKSVCPFFQRMPETEHEAFMEDFLDTLASIHLRQPMENSDDYRFVVKYKLLVANARKADCKQKNILLKNLPSQAVAI